jgi:hypothetical protein
VCAASLAGGPPVDRSARKDRRRRVCASSYFDRINEVGATDQLKGADQLPRLYHADYAILKLLDRTGLAPRVLIGRATMPDCSLRSVHDRLVKLAAPSWDGSTWLPYAYCGHPCVATASHRMRRPDRRRPRDRKRGDPLVQH